MTETISIDVPVFFPCATAGKWESIEDLRSAIDVIKDKQEGVMKFVYKPSVSYDGLGEYARGETFPINATMVNVTTRSQNPLINPLFIRSIPWQTVEFNGVVKCRFQPAEAINGQVRVFLCESPQSLSPGNITGLMSGTQLSHSFGCTDTHPYTFRLFDGVKRYDNALNGMVTPGTVSFNELLLNKDLKRQYNNRCDMFSIHLLYDSVIPAGGPNGENYFAEGAKIGTLTFTFDVNFLVSRGSAYSFMLQQALFKIVQGEDIGKGDGGGSTVVTFRPNPIPMTMQNMGQNAFYGMVGAPQAVRGKARKGQRGLLQVAKDVAVKDPYLRNLMFSPECELTKAVLRQYRKIYAGRKDDEDETNYAAVSSLGGGDMLMTSTYSTGYMGVNRDGLPGKNEEEMVQRESLVAIYPHPGETLGYISEFLKPYLEDRTVDMPSLITGVNTVNLRMAVHKDTFAKGKPKVQTSTYKIDGALLTLGQGGLARINASAAVDNASIKQAVNTAPPLAMGTSMIVPGSWARQTTSGAEDIYYQYAMTGFSGGLDMSSLDKAKDITDMDNTTINYDLGSYKLTFVFGGDVDGFRLYKSGIPAPEVEAPQGNLRAAGFLGTLGSILSAGAAAVKNFIGDANADTEDTTCPLTRADFMSSWKKSTVGSINGLAGMTTGFLMGPKPAGMQYAVGKQELDEKGRLMVCTFSAMFNNFIPVYVGALMHKDSVDEIMEDGAFPEHAQWWQSLPGRHIDANNGILCYTEDEASETLVPITFSEFFGEPKIINAVTPLISRYPITSEHFAECSAIACPVGENTISATAQKYFVSTGNNAKQLAGGERAESRFVVDGFDADDQDHVGVMAQCNFLSSTSGTVSFSFSLPEKLPEMVNGEVVLTDLRVDEHFYVYFQIGSQILFNGFSGKHLDENTSIFSVIADGLTGEQPDIYMQEMTDGMTIPPAVTTQSETHGYACCPFLSITGVKTTTSLTSAENSTTDIVPPDGEMQEEE